MSVLPLCLCEPVCICQPLCYSFFPHIKQDAQADGSQGLLYMGCNSSCLCNGRGQWWCLVSRSSLESGLNHSFPGEVSFALLQGSVSGVLWSVNIPRVALSFNLPEPSEELRPGLPSHRHLGPWDGEEWLCDIHQPGVALWLWDCY